MGEPATQPRAEREANLDLAKRIVEAVRNDAEWPDEMFRLDLYAFDKATHPLNSPRLMLDGNRVFALVQLLVDTREALDRACTALETEGLEETAHRLRLLDLEVR